MKKQFILILIFFVSFSHAMKNKTINAAIISLTREYDSNKNTHLLQKFAVLNTIAKKKSCNCLIRKMIINSYAGEPFFKFLITYYKITNKQPSAINQKKIINTYQKQKKALKNELSTLKFYKNYKILLFSNNIPYKYPLPKAITYILTQKAKKKIGIGYMAKHMRKITKQNCFNQNFSHFSKKQKQNLKTTLFNLLGKKYELSDPTNKDIPETKVIMKNINGVLRQMQMPFTNGMPYGFCDINIKTTYE
ncbi:hypothetical protein KAH94_03110 [bacterium]|nr:hypothetical protein [bacterium]